MNYYVEVVPYDSDPNNSAIIHLGDCPKCKKGRIDTIKYRDRYAPEWWGPYGTYRYAEQLAETNNYTGMPRRHSDCYICNPKPS